MSYGPIPHRERRNIRFFILDNTAAQLEAIMLQVDAMRADTQNGQQTTARTAQKGRKPLQIGQSEADT